MRLQKSYILLVIFIFIFSCFEDKQIETSQLTVVPLVKEMDLNAEVLKLKKGFIIKTQDKTLQKLQVVLNDFQAAIDPVDSNAVPIVPKLEASYKDEQYQLQISNEIITILGGSYKALVYGLTTLIQHSINKSELNTGVISDQPDFGYRGLMLDLSRNWHNISSLKQAIVLASYYKINYLQLHLTDDALFTFQSKRFPKLASKQSYSLEDLKQLNAFANTRGVTLVPEIDIPGHSSGFIRGMPELFGLNNVSSNPYTLNMGKETVYDALEVLFSEVSEAFPYSPYIHLGGDEVFTEGFAEDSHVKNYLKTHELDNVEELYRHFLVRISEIIKRNGKQAMLWSGFEREGAVEIPKDVIIMNWKPSAYTPDDMIEDGYQIINASWQPLYVVNNRKWTPETIYNWTVYDWKGFATPYEAQALKASKSTQLLGGSMEVWEQNQFKLYASLKKRLPAMAERLWNSNNKTDYLKLSNRVETTDTKIKSVLFPFVWIETGLTFDKTIEPNFREDMWFQDQLELTLKPITTDLELRYTLDGSDPTISSDLYTEPLILNKRSRFSIQAYKKGIPIGQTLLKDYQLMPVKLDIKGLHNTLQPGSWERHKFLDSISVTLDSKRDGTIHYTTDNSVPTLKSPSYTKPFIIKTSGLLRAKLFDANGQQIGSERREEYEQLILENSLTTGKPVTTSNAFEAGIPEVINDGKISRWDHWGAHTNGNNWVVVDLEKETTVNAFKTYTFWDNYRYYEYTISVSNDNENWTMVVDNSKNRTISTPKGQLDSIEPIKARYLKLQIISNSANPGLHLVEFNAF